MKRFFKRFVFIFLALYAPENIRSQYNPLALDYLTIDQGLSQNTVYKIIQDSAGFLWFATQDGLNRYDGYEFTVYRNRMTDSLSLCNNYILDMLTDRNGRFWIATTDGLALYEAEYNVFRNFRSRKDDESGLPDNHIRVLREDRRGNLWIGTTQGLAVFDRERKSFQRIDPGGKRERDFHVLSICEDHQGFIWIGLNSGRLIRMKVSDNGETSVISEFSKWNSTHRTVNNNIWCIYEDRQRNLWMGTELGLYQFDTLTFNWNHLKNDIPANGRPTELSVRSIHEDRFGSLRIGTNNGLYAYDRTLRKLRPALLNGEPAGKLSGKRIRCLFSDRNDGLWIGTDGDGVIKMDRHRQKFHLIRKQPDSDAGLNHHTVLSVTEDREGALWIGTLGGGLNYCNRKTGQWKYYTHQSANPRSLSDNNVRALVFDAEGTLWAGTLQGGLNALNVKTGIAERFTHRAGDTNSLSNNAVTSMCITRDGRIWIGTYNGLNVLHPRTRRFRRFFHDDHDSNSLSHNQIRTLYEDNAGRLWVGTFGGGLNLYDDRAGRFKIYRHDPQDTATLSSNIIRGILSDRKNRLWVGTDRGLNLMNPADGRCVRFDEQDRLPNQVIYSLIEDRTGDIWISTNNGLARFNPDSLAGSTRNQRRSSAYFRHFTVSDGLQGMEFNQSAAFISEKGEIFFGGLYGLNHFYPEHIRDNPFTPRVVWTDFLVFNEPAPFSERITYMSRVELPYDDNYFTIGFAALDFTDPSRNQYAYKMEGFDKNWIYAGTRRFASYTNLNGGEYVFHVRAANNDGVWNHEGIRIHVSIIPPWWERWWFRFLALACLSGMIWMFLHVRMHVIRKRNAELERIVAERTESLRVYSRRLEDANSELRKLNDVKNEFLGIAAHDVRNPLGIIINFVKVILRDLQTGHFNPEEIREDLQNILKAAEQTVRLVNTLLDISAIESGKINMDLHQEDMSAILEECEHRHYKRAQQKKINLAVEKNRTLPPVHIDRTRITEVMDNLMSNALKFTYPGGSIRVYCEHHPGEIVTHIQDSGQGLNERDMANIFRSFKKLSARPTDGEHSTGLGLAIVKKIVEMHGGKVWVDSKYGEGSIFSFSLPVHDN